MQSTRSESDRRPVIWAISISRLEQLFHEVVPQYTSFADIRIQHLGFEEALAAVNEALLAGELDAVVAAGSNGNFLRRQTQVPVALVKVSSADMLGALARARRMADRIGVITHQSTNPELTDFSVNFGLQLEQRSYVTTEDARNAVHELAALGIGAIVGPGLVTDLAEDAGLAGIFLYSRDTVSQALDDAVEMARVARIESARRERLDTILRQLNEGVVAVDMQERIESLNPAIEQLLNLPAEDAVGRRLSDIAPELALRRTLETGAAEIERIQTLGPRTIVTSRMPIREQGIQTGAVLTVQDPAAIQRVDRNLRSRSRPRHSAPRYEIDQIVGGSMQIARCRELASRFARSDGTVLILGESGCGKELFAQGIHNASRRRRHAFVAVNCAAFPESLLESELFGYEEGAFSGSRRGGKPGLFEIAHTGTIFLDEIGEMPIALQTRLLRVLQEKEVWRLGATEPTPVDVRVIAATHRNLLERIAHGQFRQDLYYRLNILCLEVPPLRARKEDIPALGRHLLDRALRRSGDPASGREAFDGLLPHLMRHDWLGNVRELENVIERMALFCAGEEDLRHFDAAAWRDLFPELYPAHTTTADSAEPLPIASRSRDAAHVRRVLEECAGDRNAACKRLGISRTTLWRKLRIADSV